MLSMAQCRRTDVANSLTFGARLLMEYWTSLVSLPSEVDVVVIACPIDLSPFQLRRSPSIDSGTGATR